MEDKFIIQFVLWLDLECEPSGSRDGWFIYKKEWLTVDECLEVFKEINKEI